LQQDPEDKVPDKIGVINSSSQYPGLLMLLRVELLPLSPGVENEWIAQNKKSAACADQNRSDNEAKPSFKPSLIPEHCLHLASSFREKSLLAKPA
jgi:hypothetical protein